MTTDTSHAGLKPRPDDADWQTVLAYVRACAMAWVGDARLLGNARASDIVRAINDALRTTDAAQGRIAALEVALRPFDACVFNDNGDVTISTGHLTDYDWLKLRRALSPSSGDEIMAVVDAAVNWKFGRGENPRGSLTRAVDAYLAALDTKIGNKGSS
ncbi:MAG TPA: hypothetical protein VGO34_14715 [Alphaproteobacteria bacterium]